MSCPPSHHLSLIRLPKQKGHLEVQLLISLTILSICFLPFSGRGLTGTKPRRGPDNAEQEHPARLSESVAVSEAGRGNFTINLSDDREVLTVYAGPAELQEALEQNRTLPRSLAAADFDEDGVPDLVSDSASLRCAELRQGLPVIREGM